MIKRFLILSLILFLGPGTVAFAAGAIVLNVTVDHGVPLTLTGPAASVFIANPEIADVQVMSPTEIMVFGKRAGETTFMATDSKGQTLSHRTVLVTQDLSSLRHELDAAIPHNQIKVQSLPNGIVLTGEAKDPASVADAYKLAQRYLPGSGGDIINRIKVVGSNQIMLRVRFAEVSRSVDDTLGIDWDSAMSYGGFSFGLASGNPISGVLAAGQTVTRPNNTSLTAPNDVGILSHVGRRTNINNMIDALSQDGLVTILAEPNLTAMSGETASFLVGGEIPVPIPQASTGNQTTLTVEWKQYGISLEFTPTLISDSRINLHVKPEVSQLTNIGSITTDNITIPGLTTRKAETTVELASGQSFAIAGLLDNNQSQTVDKYPIIGDMPVLGALFRSNHFQNGQTELIVIVTPYVVTPTGEQLALPMDGYSPPSQTDRLLGLRYNSSDPTTRTMSGPPTAIRVEPPHAEPPLSSAAPVLQDDTTAMAPAPDAAPALEATREIEPPVKAPATAMMAPVKPVPKTSLKATMASPPPTSVAPADMQMPQPPMDALANPVMPTMPALAAGHALAEPDNSGAPGLTHAAPVSSDGAELAPELAPTMGPVSGSAASAGPMPIHLNPIHPATATVNPTGLAPAGPGGFTLE